MIRPAAAIALMGLVLAGLAAGSRAQTPPPSRRGADPPRAASGEGAPPVILVTVDGVRYREVFTGLDPGLARAPTPGGDVLLPRLRQRAAREGFLAGDADRGDPFAVRNLAACSLPGYQSILAGRDLGCWDNRCGRIRVETVLERARRALGLETREVAVFASWPEIALAVAHDERNLIVNVASEPFWPTGKPDAAVEELLRAEREDRPPWRYRRDRYTWALAMRYLETFRPRVLYVGLGDPDEWAHRGDYAAYTASVRELDARLEDLFQRLGAMGDYGAGASVLVTTDHGRGSGADWTKHGFWHPGSHRAWLFASTPATRAAPGRPGGGRYDHLSIRPTIEGLLGLAACDGCEAPIAELLSPGAAGRPEAVTYAGGGP